MTGLSFEELEIRRDLLDAMIIRDKLKREIFTLNERLSHDDKQVLKEELYDIYVKTQERKIVESAIDKILSRRKPHTL